RNTLSAYGKQNDIFQKAKSARLAAVLIVDVAVDVIGVCQVDELCARVKVAIVPAREPQACGGAGRRFYLFVQIEKHELARVKLKAELTQRMIDRSAEGHQLRFDARKIRQRTHAIEHLFKQAARNRGLVELRRDVEAADQAFLLFHHVKSVAGGGAIFVGHATGERAGFKKALDKFQCAPVVPMKFVAPVKRLFLK